MQPVRGADVGLDRLGEWPQRGGDGAYPVGQRRDVDRHALAAEALALAVQRQVQPELAEHHLGQQVRAGPAAGDRMERRRRLGDRLAAPAGHLLAHVLDHEPARRHPLQSLGDVLAQLAQLAAAAGAGARHGIDDPLARQMLRQRAARRFAAREGANWRLYLSRFGRDAHLGGSLFQRFERELQLLDARRALG